MGKEREAIDVLPVAVAHAPGEEQQGAADEQQADEGQQDYDLHSDAPGESEAIVASQDRQ
jgi:hypothetical protein